MFPKNVYGSVNACLIYIDDEGSDSFYDSIKRLISELTIKKDHHPMLIETKYDGDQNEEEEQEENKSTIKHLPIFNNFYIISKEKTIEENINDIKNSQIVFVPPYHSRLDDKIIEFLNNEITYRGLAIIFFRGIEPDNLPFRLNIINNHYVDWAYGKTFQLNYPFFLKYVTNDKNQFCKELFPLIENYGKDLEKLSNISKDEVSSENTPKRIKVENHYINGILPVKVHNFETDWICFANAKCENYKEDGCSILLSKKKRILFNHWYGYSESDSQFSKDLTYCFIRYLLFEHLNYVNIWMTNKLSDRIEDGKLGDIEFV
ncbi:hypothetical protein ABK040_015567 [Willaertia magna]